MKQIKGMGSSITMGPRRFLPRRATRLVRVGWDGFASISKVQMLIETPSSTVKDRVQRRASMLAQHNARTEEVRHEIVASIKSAINAETYGVSASALADRLMEIMFD